MFIAAVAASALSALAFAGPLTAFYMGERALRTGKDPDNWLARVTLLLPFRTWMQGIKVGIFFFALAVMLFLTP